MEKRKKIWLLDSTLRDGAQGEDISFSVQDKLNIVQILDRLGIDYIEAGNPGSNPKDLEFFERVQALHLNHAKLVAFGSTRRKNEAVEDDAETLKIDMLEDSRNEIQALHDRSAVREEIDEFERKLLEFGISFPEVADNCPRQGRTLAACQRVLAAARRAPALLDELLGTGKLPVTALARASGVERKTMERHRKYLVAVLLAFTNGYEIIRGHLYHLSSSDGPGAADGPASEGSRENGA